MQDWEKGGTNLQVDRFFFFLFLTVQRMSELFLSVLCPLIDRRDLAGPALTQLYLLRFAHLPKGCLFQSPFTEWSALGLVDCGAGRE